MSAIKRLAGQTAIYGIPTILGRFLQYLMVVFLTRVFSRTAEYGTISVFYAYASFLMVVLTYGMETTFFRFTQDEEKRKKVFSTAMMSLIITTSLFLLLSNIFSKTIAAWIGYPDHPEYVIWFAWILGLDTMAAIPFARLRAQNKPVRFAIIKLINIFINIGLTLFWLVLCPYLLKHGAPGTSSSVFHIIYQPDIRIGYVFLANLAASILTLVLLFPQIMKMRWDPDPALWRKMLLYAWPLLFAGMAGIVNETFDRLLLRYLLPAGIAESQVGIYSACYKISILMTLFVQAYRFAAEPFFFAQAKEKDAKIVYARIMDYFIITVSVIFLVTMLYLDDFFIYFIGRTYRTGRNVIPILLLANLFLGVYYNLSIWYKLISKTIWGAWFSVIGAVITLILNFWWIPLDPSYYIHGYVGSAWATFICYGSMMVISYLVGQKFYPIPYNMKKFLGYLGFSVILYLISTLMHFDHAVIRIAVNTLLLIVFVAVVFLIEKPHLIKSR